MSASHSASLRKCGNVYICAVSTLARRTAGFASSRAETSRPIFARTGEGPPETLPSFLLILLTPCEIARSGAICKPQPHLDGKEPGVATGPQDLR